VGGKRPLFSIIIPTYNRPRQLHECLKSIERLEFPKKRFESFCGKSACLIQISRWIPEVRYIYALLLRQGPKNLIFLVFHSHKSGIEPFGILPFPAADYSIDLW